MLQKNELRIGNILIHPQKDNQIFVIRTGADIDDLYARQELNGYPINDRILHKCGATKIYEDDTMWKIDELEFDLRNEGLVLLDTAGDTLPGTKYMVYLHELQNLFTSLTGKELEVKLGNY